MGAAFNDSSFSPFHRDSSLTHYEIKASNSLEKYHRVSPPFNFTFQNHSNAVAIPVNCSVNLQPYKQLNVHISGVLRTDSLETVKFKSLALVTTASIAMEASGPMFLREEKSVRHMTE
ncbi:UNVERIFIED_CONTAM: hypothetical protein FKN15_052893 [Acipenser sinensis]